MTTIKIFLALFLVIFTHTSAWAITGSYENAIRLRRAIEATPADYGLHSLRVAGETIKLPVSRGFNQEGTSLCWSYSTLNALETVYLARHEGKKLELSRGFMQYVTMAGRFLDKIYKVQDFISERGTAVDAIILINKWGLVQYSEYPNIKALTYNSMNSQIFAQSGVDAQIKTLRSLLDGALAPLPEETTYEGRKVSKVEFGAFLVGSGRWVAYAPSNDEGVRNYPDIDARKGTLAYFMPIKKIVDKIRTSLQRKIPVEYGANGHSTLIYGAEYDSAGLPTLYYIKDSYPNYFYTADPYRTHNNMLNITTVD